jgi:hypothetical protein
MLFRPGVDGDRTWRRLTPIGWLACGRSGELADSTICLMITTARCFGLWQDNGSLGVELLSGSGKGRRFELIER